jgi:acetyl-CoA acetyltransferase
MPANTESVRGKAAIVGAADIVSPTGQLDKSCRELEMQAIREALDDAGLSLSDVDGLLVAGGSQMAALETAAYLGIQPTYIDSTMSGGSSYEIHVEHAMQAVAHGHCEVAVSVYAATPRSAGGRFGRGGGGDPFRPNPVREFDMPYGITMPMGSYALSASRHFAEFGTTSEQLAQIAVSTREWAGKNPRARYRDPITIDDVTSSSMMCSPLHKLDCCLVVDGAGAIVVTTAERAKDLKKKPVFCLGAGTATTHMNITQMPDLSTTPGAISGPAAFDRAGVKPSDVDLLMSYDSFTITVLLSLEDLGFCKKGEGGAFVEDGKLGPGGAFPTNTNGGGLSYCHPGMYGMFLLVEATKQIRGDAGERQLDNVDIAVAHGSGGVLSCMSTVVLGSEAAL